jgi:GAF domain-containing protein
MDENQALGQIKSILEASNDSTERAKRIAGVIRQVGRYRWVGVYEVTEDEIGVLGWSGPGAPAYPRFPRSQGLCGVAVSSGTTVVVDDVTADPRYLTTFGSTRSEIVVPVVRETVRGLIDVESERPHAFGDADRTFLERCASTIVGLWQG